MIEQFWGAVQERAKPVRRSAVRQAGGCGGDDIPSVKGVGTRVAAIPSFGEFADFEVSATAEKRGDHSVVGSQDPLIVSTYQQEAPLTADAGIDDTKMNRPFRKDGEDGENRPRCGGNILRRDLMRDIHDPDGGSHGEDDPFHLGDVSVRQSKVREHRQDGWIHGSSAPIKVRDSGG